MEQVNTAAWRKIMHEAEASNASLVAVSKKKPGEAIQELHAHGQRDFGENYVQELLEKQRALPQDIRWHFTGHLQKNKVRQIVPFVHLIHAVDSVLLLEEIAKQSAKLGKSTQVLLQMHIAQEDTKFGFDEAECREALRYYKSASSLREGVRVRGLMGMATFTDDTAQVRAELQGLRRVYELFRQEFFAQEASFDTLSMGMSDDYHIALEAGSTMIRVGSLLFGART